MFILTTIPGYSLERNCFIINMRTCVWMGVRMFVSNISFRLFECCVTSVKKSLKGMATFCWSNNVIYTTPSADWRLVDLERQCLEYVTIHLLTTLNSTSKQQHPKVWHMKSKKKKQWKMFLIWNASKPQPRIGRTYDFESNTQVKRGRPNESIYHLITNMIQFLQPKPRSPIFVS